MEELSEIKLEDSDLSLTTDALVYGAVLSEDKDGLWLDIGKKYDAFLPYTELSKELKSKIEKKQKVDKILVIIQHINFKDGVILVSNKKAIENKIWEELMWAYENEKPIRGKVIDYQDRQFIIEIENEITGIIPQRDIDIPPFKPPKFYLNKKVEGKIVKINPERRQLIISVRKLLEKEQEEKRLDLWEKIKNSDIVRGKIIKVEDDKITVELGFGIIGTVNYDELSWFPIKNVKRFFDVGDIVKAKILKLNDESKTAELSIKQTQPNPWSVFKEKYPVGSITEGEIIKITNGILVKIDNLLGYVPQNEITWGRVSEEKEKFKVGDKIKVKVLSVDDEKQRITLSIKQTEPYPWEVIDDILKVDDITKGKITNITDFGIFLEIKPGLEGLIPKRYISWERIDDLSTFFKIGDVIEVKVINIDKENRKLTLSRRDLLKDPWEDIEKRYKEGDNIKGKIVEKTKDGIIIEIEPGIEGFLPQNQIYLDKEFNEDITEYVEAKIIKINTQNRKIILSRKALLKERLEKEIKEQLKEFTPPPLTLGEILKLKNIK
jgi:small subunit ribosomal protein S1